MPEYQVFLARPAEDDLADITEYIECRDSPSRAGDVYQTLKRAVLSLEATPYRGRVVPELRALGVMGYREILRGPYRIVYFIREQAVYVVAVLDGRRDLEDLLRRRLLS